MADLLLELFSEEIPARMQANALNTLMSRVRDGLREARLDASNVVGFVTPRRLAVRVEGLPLVQPDISTERKGPKVGAPEQALQGFCRSVGLSVDALEIREKGKDKFYFAVSEEKGKPVADALSDVLNAALRSFPWPKSQRWGATDMTWVRPLKRIVAIFADDSGCEVIPVQLGHVVSSNVTEGHRFLSEGAIELNVPTDYEAVMEANHVLVDAEKRRLWIVRDMAQAASEKGLSVKADEKLLDEVTGLVEWPICLLGEYDKEFLDLPPEVLVLEMRHHQKYFACLDENAKLSNHFLLVSNMKTADNGTAIVAGNQRVIRARLADGEFYWDQDRKKPLEAFTTGLEKMIFHAKLGTMADKIGRVSSLATFLAVFVPHANLDRVSRAAQLTKADLVSGMVGEFPELQGVMGCYYATAQGEHADVANAIAEHYKPVGQDDDVPKAPVTVAVALADKIDTLVGLFAADEKPTGSKDPFALRRAALGVIRIILENDLRMPLKLVFDNAAGRYPKALFKERKIKKEVVVEELLAFFSDRLKVMLKGKGVRHDLIEAVFDGGNEDDLVRLVARVESLLGLANSEDGASLLGAYRRAANILNKEETADGKSYAGKVDESLLGEAAEKELFKALEKIENPVNKALSEEDFSSAMIAVSALHSEINQFFDDVIVNADAKDLRENRLQLLARFRNLLNELANLSLVVLKD